MNGRAVDVLVVGAGPTGLALGLQAHDHGARVRVLERRVELFRPSRAMIMHPRTLELLRPLGVTDALLARGVSSVSMHLHIGTRVVVVRSDRLDLPSTAFPHLLLIRQADVEDVLARALDQRGIEVERGSEVVGIRPGEGDRVVVQHRERDEDIQYRYLVGCDGAASLIRRFIGEWRGSDYREEVVLADLEVRGGTGLQSEAAHVVAGRRGLLFLFPIGEFARWRMLAARPVVVSPRSSEPADEPVPRSQLQALLDGAHLPVVITDVGWSSSIRVQHRLATHFSRGRLFIAGDAAHAQSPAAGQGMNMGTQDALNLGWKLAFAAQAGGPVAKLLDSYHLERRPADRRVLWLTGAVFWAEASEHPLAQLARGFLAPLGVPFIPWVTRRRRLMDVVARTLAQFRVHYRHSPLSADRGSPRMTPRRSVWRTSPGSRVPDIPVTCDGVSVLLHSLLAEPGVHVLLEAHSDEISPRLRGPHVTVHRLATEQGTGTLIIRPDGYVGYRASVVSESDIEDWLRSVGLARREHRPETHSR